MSVKPVSSATNVISTSNQNPIQWLQNYKTPLLQKICAIVLSCLTALFLGQHSGYVGLSRIAAVVIGAVLSFYAFCSGKQNAYTTSHPQIVSDDWGKIVVKRKREKKPTKM